MYKFFVPAIAASLAYFTMLAATTAEPSRADEAQVVSWTDLAQKGSIPNPFEELTDRPLDQLSQVARIRRLIANEKIERDSAAAAEAAKIESSLRQDGLDIDWLLAQRRHVARISEMQATTVQQDLIGKSIEISGYVIPVREENGLHTEFLLMPDVPTCSQLSPPPPNQLVYVSVSGGLAVDNRFAAATVTGRIEAKKIQSQLVRATGLVHLESAYAISADQIVVHSGTSHNEQDASDRGE